MSKLDFYSKEESNNKTESKESYSSIDRLQDKMFKGVDNFFGSSGSIMEKFFESPFTLHICGYIIFIGISFLSNLWFLNDKWSLSIILPLVFICTILPIIWWIGYELFEAHLKFLKTSKYKEKYFSLAFLHLLTFLFGLFSIISFTRSFLFFYIVCLVYGFILFLITFFKFVYAGRY